MHYDTFMTSYRVGRIDCDEEFLRGDLEHIKSFQMSPAYSEYAIGSWATCMLWNRTGNKDDAMSVEYDGHAQPTEYGHALRYLTPLTEEIFEIKHLKSARIFSAKD